MQKWCTKLQEASHVYFLRSQAIKVNCLLIKKFWNGIIPNNYKSLKGTLKRCAWDGDGGGGGESGREHCGPLRPPQKKKKKKKKNVFYSGKSWAIFGQNSGNIRVACWQRFGQDLYPFWSIYRVSKNYHYYYYLHSRGVSATLSNLAKGTASDIPYKFELLLFS